MMDDPWAWTGWHHCSHCGWRTLRYDLCASCARKLDIEDAGFPRRQAKYAAAMSAPDTYDGHGYDRIADQWEREGLKHRTAGFWWCV